MEPRSGDLRDALCARMGFRAFPSFAIMRGRPSIPSRPRPRARAGQARKERVRPVGPTVHPLRPDGRRPRRPKRHQRHRCLRASPAARPQALNVVVPASRLRCAARSAACRVEVVFRLSFTKPPQPNGRASTTPRNDTLGRRALCFGKATSTSTNVASASGASHTGPAAGVSTGHAWQRRGGAWRRAPRGSPTDTPCSRGPSRHRRLPSHPAPTWRPLLCGHAARVPLRGPASPFACSAAPVLLQRSGTRPPTGRESRARAMRDESAGEMAPLATRSSKIPSHRCRRTRRAAITAPARPRFRRASPKAMCPGGAPMVTRAVSISSRRGARAPSPRMRTPRREDHGSPNPSPRIRHAERR